MLHKQIKWGKGFSDKTLKAVRKGQLNAEGQPTPCLTPQLSRTDFGRVHIADGETEALLAGIGAWAQQVPSGASSYISKKQFQRHPWEDVYLSNKFRKLPKD